MLSDAPLQPVGIFDSGLGGLTVLRSLHRRLPGEDLIYFGDTARVPYGTKGESTVRTFARQDAGLLVDKGVKMVVVACNTASAFALDHLRDSLPVPVLGVIDPGVAAALQASAGGVVGVIGTSGTIRSGRYQEGLLAGGLHPDQILAVECPLFVPLVEEDKMGQTLMRLAVQEYLQPLNLHGPATLAVARRLAAHAVTCAARKHAILGSDPALTRPFQPAGSAVGDGCGANHMGVAHHDQARTFGMGQVISSDGGGTQLLRSPVCCAFGHDQSPLWLFPAAFISA